MRKTGLATALVLLCSFSLWSMTAEQIIQKNHGLPRPETSQGRVRLVVNTTGTDVTQTFNIFTRRFNKEIRTRINFIRPTQMQFLIFSQPGGTTRQWVKLSSGQIRQIAAGNQGGSWANSHFYYEDLKTYSPDEYSFKKLSDTTVKDRSGNTIQVYRIEATPKSANAVYSKRILYIDKQTSQIRRADFFERGRHTKTLSNYLFADINGISTPRLVYMEPASGGGNYSYLLIEAMTFNSTVDTQHFQRASF